MLNQIKSKKSILIAILILAAFFRLFRLDYPPGYVFDEVYHAFTAKEYLVGHKEAWEWWATPPPGVAYEWTHPPLAKEIMAASMFITRSTDSWAWRLPGVLLGILSVFLVYQLGKLIFKNEQVGLFSAFIFSIDGLNFVQSRTGMNDIYFVTFMLASLLFFLRKNFLWSAVFFGLSLASKWAAIYLFLVYLVLCLFYLFVQQKGKVLRARSIIFHTVVRAGLYFAILSPIVYLLIYLPFFLLGHSWDQFIGLQQQMWWYHTGLKAHHDYASAWWSWPLNLYPVWYSVEYQGSSIGNIFASGNPVIFWFGSVAIIITTWQTIRLFLLRASMASREVITSPLIILLGFFAFWLPWSVSPRIMFLYHFAPSIPFLSLALGYQLNLLTQDKENRKFVFILLALMLIGFLLIYPFLTGVALPRYAVKLFFLTNITRNPF